MNAQILESMEARIFQLITSELKVDQKDSLLNTQMMQFLTISGLKMFVVLTLLVSAFKLDFPIESQLQIFIV